MTKGRLFLPQIEDMNMLHKVRILDVYFSSDSNRRIARSSSVSAVTLTEDPSGSSFCRTRSWWVIIWSKYVLCHAEQSCFGIGFSASSEISILQGEDGFACLYGSLSVPRAESH